MVAPPLDDADLGSTLEEGIAEVLFAVAFVANGDFTRRLESDLPDDHPITILYRGVNDMIEVLAQEKQRKTVYEAELEEKLATIDVQRTAIRELATPIIEVWEGVLCLPVVGVLDSTRSAEMTESLLGAISEKSADCVIIDITGIQVMDTAAADHFLRMARAVRLLGAQCLLTGIQPAIAQTIIHMGVDLNGVITHRTLRNALQSYVGAIIGRAERGDPSASHLVPGDGL